MNPAHTNWIGGGRSIQTCTITKWNKYCDIWQTCVEWIGSRLSALCQTTMVWTWTEGMRWDPQTSRPSCCNHPLVPNRWPAPRLHNSTQCTKNVNKYTFRIIVTGLVHFFKKKLREKINCHVLVNTTHADGWYQIRHCHFSSWLFQTF